MANGLQQGGWDKNKNKKRYISPRASTAAAANKVSSKYNRGAKGSSGRANKSGVVSNTG